MATSIAVREILGSLPYEIQGRTLGDREGPRPGRRRGEVLRRRQRGGWVEVAANTGPLDVLGRRKGFGRICP